MKSFRLLLLLLIAASAFSTDLAAKTPTSKDKNPAAKGKFPTFEAVTRTVEKQLALNRNYQPGDLITAGVVDSLFRKLEKINWKVADRKEIAKLFLPESDWLARQFTSQRGREFMRQVADLPGGYDRVDRLRRMPLGQQQLADLIRSPDGYKLFEYMTTTRGGRNLGEMLSQGVNGKGFNSPTGRLYTQLDLVKRLKKSYDIEAERRLSLEPAEQQNSPPSEPATSAKPASAGETAGKRPQKAVADDDPFERARR